MRIQRILFAAALAASLSGMAAPPAARADVSVSVSFFHERLAPHGRWVSAASYGDVWIPGSVAAGWAPYLDGEWIYTDYGWTWVSDNPWGDIAYHYGTWAWVEPYGWVWIPGTVWAPSWVTWAYTDDYIGWAPVPPSFVLSIGGYSGRPIVVAETHYVFVPARQFVGVRVSRVRVAPAQNAAIFRRAAKATSFQVSNGIVRTAGLPSDRVAKAAGHKIERVPITRARTQPTAFARGGLANAKSIPVVAPAQSRVKAAPEAKASNRQPAEPEAEVQKRPESRPAPKPKSEKAQAPAPKPQSQREVRPASPAQPHAPAPKAQAPAPKPQSDRKAQPPAPAQPQASAPKAQAAPPKAKASAPKTKPQSSSRPDTSKQDKKPDTR